MKSASRAAIRWQRKGTTDPIATKGDDQKVLKKRERIGAYLSDVGETENQMSHSYGMVRFANGDILHFEYNGTTDVCIPPLWNAREEVGLHWRAEAPRWNCICTIPTVHEPVEIVSTYGGGFYWNGLACRQCQTLTDGLVPTFGNEGDPDYDGFKDGYPDWFPKDEE